MDELLYPEETDPTIIMLMTRYLLSGTVTLRRNAVMYITALHHVNRYMFTADGSKEDIRLSLLKSAKNCTTQVIYCMMELSFHMQGIPSFWELPSYWLQSHTICHTSHLQITVLRKELVLDTFCLHWSCSPFTGHATY